MFIRRYTYKRLLDKCTRLEKTISVLNKEISEEKQKNANYKTRESRKKLIKEELNEEKKKEIVNSLAEIEDKFFPCGVNISEKFKLHSNDTFVDFINEETDLFAIEDGYGKIFINVIPDFNFRWWDY